jgi:crotonobetainyl-CoA:carnitine CoA-transferase CaiB-like acyl-CoA transferase
MANTILDGITVLDLANENGVYCGRLLALMGARVIKLEATAGDCTRNIGPFAGGLTGPERSLFHAYHNAGKESVTADLDTAGGRAVLRALLCRADVVLDTCQKGFLHDFGFSYEAAAELNPRLIGVSITPFGLSGPYQNWNAASDIVPFAMGGPMVETGMPEKEPLQMGYNLLADGACIYAVTGVLAALFARGADGEGDLVEISLQETAASWRGTSFGAAQKYPEPKAAQRIGSQGIMVPSNFFRCKDGYIFMMASGRWPALVAWMKEKGIDIGDMDDPKYEKNQGLNQYLWEDIDHVNDMIAQLCLQYTKSEMMLEGQRRNVPVGTAETADTVLQSPQYNSRNYFTEINHPLLGKTLHPGAPIGFSASPCVTGKRAPMLGEHTQKVLDELASLLERGENRHEKKAFRRHHHSGYELGDCRPAR